MSRRKTPGVGDYPLPAGGWGALKAVAGALADQYTVVEGGRTLLSANQPDGFDCPGCAWPDPRHTSSFEFCENGAKAVAWEATGRRATPEVVGAHTVAELWRWSDHALEDLGRLTEPMRHDPSTDRFVRASWDEALTAIAAALRALPNADAAEFYASGRASNEAAFLFQLLGRRFGTNNFPDCSNMCHEPTSVGLAEQLGLGKGSVTLDDFDDADLILSFGHNPGTNHPRMMATLREAARRGATILVFNPMRERALEKFASPQDPVEMATLSSTDIAARYYQLKVGGDAAVLLGMMKAVIEADALDHAFIAEHTRGFETVRARARAARWPDIERRSGLTRDQIQEAAAIYARSRAAILCYGMGLTQHRSASSLVQQLVNLLLLRGQIGRPGAGICPLRGHSNVQGARTVGVTEKPSPALLDAIERTFGFTPPAAHGHTVPEAIEAMLAGDSRALICLGGNFAVAAPDPAQTFPAVRGLDLTVNIATKLNRTHLLPCKSAWLLPCLGRTEIDVQAGGRQSVTVEDSMSMVHASRGLNPPASPHLRSEPWIVAGIGRALFGPDDVIDWQGLVADYDRIRDRIEQVFPNQFEGFNARIRVPGGFRLPVPSGERVFATPDGRAAFLPYVLDVGTSEDAARGDSDVLVLTTLRSHDQYNTTIYGLNDRYRGVKGRRDLIFANIADLAARGLADGDRVDLRGAFDEGIERVLRGFTVIARDIPAGCLAAYYPEANPLLALSDRDQRSGTPAYKSMPVRMTKAG
ncbi:MAG: FdhF/YdeP family oxidoreductase [Caulobacter sp.]|nr:FdhF/YdeP family oxidoreductase [Caulobacter sp.]